MKQLQRLLFQQGNRCFFCASQIPEGQASVEHLDALSNGGEKNDQNCVVCCKAVNTALSNLSVKEKFRTVLSQSGPFACPMNITVALIEPENPTPDDSAAAELLEEVIENLRKRGTKRPVRLATLRNAIAGSFTSATAPVIEFLLARLRERGIVSDNGTKVTYLGFKND